jgi:hypothetical protein
VERVRVKDELMRKQKALLNEKSQALRTQKEYSSKLSTQLVCFSTLLMLNSQAYSMHAV